jgi:hypothetical protein
VKISVLGAPGTGKTWLAQELVSSLRSRGHKTKVLRLSEPDSPDIEIAISDASALSVAVQLNVERKGKSLYDDAVEAQRTFDLTLLTGLDLPQTPTDLQRLIDARLREVLQVHGLRYSVVYGAGDQRLRSALSAIDRYISPGATAPGTEPSRWQWVCDKCSDAQCEHQMFSALLKQERAQP